MMSDEDIKEYHNIGKKPGLKKSNKYNYIQGKQITDHGTGKRVYEIDKYRLPSVTTILGATKNTEFLTKWKAKVGEAEADRIKNVSSARGTCMHKFLEHHVLGTGCVDLTSIGQEARPMADKIIEMGLAPVEEYYASEVTLHYPGLYAGQTDLVCNTQWYGDCCRLQTSQPSEKGRMDRRLFHADCSVRHGTRLCLRK
jgi:hypothetical protein